MSDYYNPVAACMIRNRTKEREMRDELKDRAIALLKDTWAQGYEAGVKATNVDCGVVWEERIDAIKADISEYEKECQSTVETETCKKCTADTFRNIERIINMHVGGDAE